MSASLTYDPATQLAELHISGVLKRAELSGFENEIASRIDAGELPRVLVLLENFGGWQAGGIESAWQQIAKLHQRATSAA